MTSFDRAYRDVIARIMHHGEEVYSERTKQGTRALPGVTFQADLSKGFPLLTLRKIPVRLFVSEVVWMCTGEKDLSFVQKFTKIWDQFAEDDNTMQTAYGYRWRRHFGRDQLLDLAEHLKREPSSRQGVVLMWDPASDGLTAPKKKNVPCPFAFTVNIINGRLNLHLLVRSNDMMLGNPHDVAGFGLLCSMLAQELKTGVGILTISISHAHVYEEHYEQAETVINRMPQMHEEIICRLPENSFQRALRGDESLVKEITQMFRAQYNPMPAVKKMKIAL